MSPFYWVIACPNPIFPCRVIFKNAQNHYRCFFYVFRSSASRMWAVKLVFTNMVTHSKSFITNIKLLGLKGWKKARQTHFWRYVASFPHFTIQGPTQVGGAKSCMWTIGIQNDRLDELILMSHSTWVLGTRVSQYSGTESRHAQWRNVYSLYTVQSRIFMMKRFYSLWLFGIEINIYFGRQRIYLHPKTNNFTSILGPGTFCKNMSLYQDVFCL